MGLKISVCNSYRVKILDSSKYLEQDSGSVGLIDLLAALNILHQISLNVLHDEEELGLALNYFVEFDGVGVGNRLQNCYLSRDVVELLQIRDPLLVHDFYSNELLGQFVFGQPDFPKCALAHRAACIIHILPSSY